MKQNILIAGGTDGIGLSFLERTLNEDHYDKVYVLGRKFNKVTDYKDNRIVQIECDITDNIAVHTAVDSVKEDLDIFVNTIGTFAKKPISELTAEDITNHFQLNTIANINLTKAILPKLNPDFAQILVCLATLAVQPRANYSLQSSTKVAYKYFLDVLRQEQGDKLRIMTIMPPSVKTEIFAKSGDNRDTNNYAEPSVVSDGMSFMLNQPRNVEVKELVIENR